MGHSNFTGLFDKGYHTGAEFKKASDLEIYVLVSIPRKGKPSQAPDSRYNSENFVYNNESDTYTCPDGQTLHSNGKWYQGTNAKFKQYKTGACKTCPVEYLCTTSKANGKIVQRSEYKEYIEANAERMKSNLQTYLKRQAIVEHPFGTLKRSWGFNYILTKKYKQRASADVGFMFIAYNLKRIWNILKDLGIEFIFNRKNLFCNSILSILSLFIFSLKFSKQKIRVA